MTMMAALLLAGVASPALAQRAPADVGQRVDKLESQMRAVQRKVFPGGNQQYFEAEIPPPAAAAPVPGAGASAPIVDLTARVNSLEQALARLTGEVETNSFKLRQLEQAVAKLNASPEAASPPPVIVPSEVPFGSAPARPAPPFTAPPPAPRPAPAPPPAVAPTGDAAEDLYLSGYRLWAAKDYAGAEKVLRQVVAKYPDHRRASYAQNLYGRSLLDDGQPAKAAEAFYSNYQKMPRGERAPDSLYFLGQSLMALKPAKPADACKVYDELLDVYGEKISADLKAKVARGKTDAKCGK
jgi:TolA-binding protein